MIKVFFMGTAPKCESNYSPEPYLWRHGSTSARKTHSINYDIPKV